LCLGLSSFDYQPRKKMIMQTCDHWQGRSVYFPIAVLAAKSRAV
jgi:hypothetical protein